MHPVMFRWRGLTIHSYPAMQYLGLICGILCGNIAAHRFGLDPFKVFVASFLLMFPMLGGARLLFVAIHWSEYKHHRSLIWKTTEGGAAQYGGILIGVPISIPLLSFLQLPFGGFWDIGAITIMTGMILTRIGCFLNGCCAGRCSHSWIAMMLPNYRGDWERRLPTQLLEAGWALFLLTTAVALHGAMPFQGALFIYVAAGYATGRLLLESLREAKNPHSRFTIQHAISLFIVTLSLAALTIRL